jgi:hypothetical protein
VDPALSGSELGAGDVLVATTKQDCSGSSNHSEHGQIGVERLPSYAVAVAQTNRAVVPSQSLGREGPGRPHVRPSRGKRCPRWTRLTSGGNVPLLPQHNETPDAGVCATATAYTGHGGPVAAFVGKPLAPEPRCLATEDRKRAEGRGVVGDTRGAA